MTNLLQSEKFLKNLENSNLGSCILYSGYNIRYETTNLPEFDILDEQSTIILKKGEGGVTYQNKSSDSINILDYEDFIQNLKNKKKGIKSCDFLVYSTKKNFFICNELSIGKHSNKWPKARYQFIDTLKYLYKSNDIKTFINSFANKMCLLSLRDEIPDTPEENMLEGFFEPYKLQKKPEKLEYKPIDDKYNFSIWEANLIAYNTDESISILN